MPRARGVRASMARMQHTSSHSPRFVPRWLPRLTARLHHVVVAVSAFGLGLLSLPSHALPWVQLTQSVLIHIPAKDVPAFKTFIGETLRSAPAGQAQSWHSQQHGRQAPVQVSVTPSAAVHTDKAGTCRRLDATVQQGPRSEPWSVWFCLDPQGHWKISGLA